MKKLSSLFLIILFCGCVSLTGTYSYIPIGPQNLSQTVTDYKKMPVFTYFEEIKRPWARLGVMRVKNLPNDREVINAEIDKLKAKAAKKGADAVIINRDFDENAASPKYPINIAMALVRFMDKMSEEDQQKVADFAPQAAMDNAK